MNSFRGFGDQEIAMLTIESLLRLELCLHDTLIARFHGFRLSIVAESASACKGIMSITLFYVKERLFCGAIVSSNAKRRIAHGAANHLNTKALTFCASVNRCDLSPFRSRSMRLTIHAVSVIKSRCLWITFIFEYAKQITMWKIYRQNILLREDV
eukprot:3094243-Pleurochrysis_carterae.AAC.5